MDFGYDGGFGGATLARMAASEAVMTSEEEVERLVMVVQEEEEEDSEEVTLEAMPLGVCRVARNHLRRRRNRAAAIASTCTIAQM